MAALVRGEQTVKHTPRAVPSARISVIGAFELTISGRPVLLSHSAERVIAYLALAARPVRRSRVAGELWPDVPEHRALGNLRSALWRTPGADASLVIGTRDQLALTPGVRVDLSDLHAIVDLVRTGPSEAMIERLGELTTAAEILTDWEEEWLEHHREQFHELWLHILDRMCDRLLADTDYGRAIGVCLLMIEADPYRESARRQLVRAYLGEGNVADALRAYAEYRALLHDELDVAPSALMEQVIAQIRIVPEADAWDAWTGTPARSHR